MSNIQTVKNLLENVVGITVKYEPIHRERRFNIFTILRRGHEEVALHSRFIAELLDPKGKHGHGDEFLKLFLQHIVGEDTGWLEEDDGGASVEIERPFHAEKKGRIDILIRTPSRIVVLENKIYASDQSHQLDRYYEFAKRETKRLRLPLEPIVCYLTLFRKGPQKSTWSEGPDHPALRVPSYKDIRNWLDDCLARAALEPALRETIQQYQLLIDRLRGETMSKDEKQEVVAAIRRSEESVKAAQAIHGAWDDALAAGILEYWKDLETCCDELVGSANLRHEMLPPEAIKKMSYSPKRIKNIVKRARGKEEKNHGVIVPVIKKPYENKTAVICLYVEAEAAYGQGMIFGIRLVEMSPDGTYTYTINNEARYNDLAEQITPEGSSRTKHWLAMRQLEKVPNLTSPYGEEVAGLMLEDKRKEAVDATMEQVKELHDFVQSRLS